MTRLLSERGSIAFLVAVFLNAFIDLGHKIVIQNTVFKIHEGDTLVILTAIVNGLILLPFILLFTPAGFFSDRFAKHSVMRATAWGAVALTLLITLFYSLGWFWAAFAMTFLLAAQSAIYSPAKMAYIRKFFGKEKLAEANGVVSATAIIAILMGTLVFSILFESVFPQGAQTESEIIQTLVPLGFILFINSLFELFMIYRLPAKDEANKEVKFSAGEFLQGEALVKNIQPVLNKEVIRLSIIGLAMFWSIGQVMLAAFPAFAKAQTGETNTIIIQAILAASGLGIALGSIIAAKVSKNYIETGLIPVGAAGIAIGLLILPNLNSQLLMGLDFFFIGTMGGMFIVPLNAMVQYHAKEAELGKVLAGNNLFQNIAMLSFLLITIAFTFSGLSSKDLLIFTALFSVIGGCYTVYKLPQSLLRFMLSFIMKKRYRVNVEGMRNIPNDGGVLLLGNHISWIDWAVIQIACPRPVQFVMARKYYERWYLTWFFKMFGCVPIEGGASSRDSLNTVSKQLNEGNIVCLFPEGVISRTGHLAEFKRGFERALEGCDDSVTVVPFYLRGLWGSQFSYSSTRLKNNSEGGWKRDLIIAFGPPQDRSIKADELKRRVFDLSISSWKHYVDKLPTLAHAWIETIKKQGKNTAIADTLSDPLSGNNALAATFAFASKMEKISPENNIGLILPTSAGAVIANMAVLTLGKTVVNLNYTAAPSAISSAIEQAEIKTVYTSKRFLKKLESRGIDLSETLANCRLIYLEELKNEISKASLVRKLIAIRLLPASLLKLIYCRKQNTDSTAAILFSSGSEGQPKGVCLSHTNFMANVKQISDILNTRDDDCVMASLPLFHAFGLTVTQFLPLIEGIPMVCHADPTDAAGVGKAVAKYRASILFGTSTFLRIYSKSKKLHPLMFESLRKVIAGAEKLKPEVRNDFEAKFQRRVLEGYGATETTPVASVNVPDFLDIASWRAQIGGKLGTVGMPLPGTSIKIVNPENFEELPSKEDGMILIGGAQVMQGYLNNESKTNEVIKVIENQRWYVTGDKGHLDTDGFLTIVDRYSRFAKLGGEMVSLSSVELAITQGLEDSYPELEVVAVSLEDAKKGEKLVILTSSDLRIEEIKEGLNKVGASKLMFPNELIIVEELPKLGSGKTDFATAKLIAKNHNDA